MKLLNVGLLHARVLDNATGGGLYRALQRALVAGADPEIAAQRHVDHPGRPSRWSLVVTARRDGEEVLREEFAIDLHAGDPESALVAGTVVQIHLADYVEEIKQDIRAFLIEKDPFEQVLDDVLPFPRTGGGGKPS